MALIAGAFADFAKRGKNVHSVHCSIRLPLARRLSMILTGYHVLEGRSSAGFVGVGIGECRFRY